MPGDFEGTGTAEVEITSISCPSPSTSSGSDCEEILQSEAEKVILERRFIQYEFNHSIGLAVGYDHPYR